MGGYRLQDYARMIGDGNRNAAYSEAIRRVVTPGSAVLDIGTGTGVWAFAAARAGARRVYAVEVSPVVYLARELASRNHLADRIVFIERLSSEISLPEPVDVVISDIRGVLPLAGVALESIVDARDRLLRPGGVLIPRADTLYAAVVAAPSIFAAVVEVWDAGFSGVDAAPIRRAACQEIVRVDARDVRPLTRPAKWATVDYRTVRSPSLLGRMEWEITEDVLAHGFALWFQADLAEGVGYSTAPEGGDSLYGLALLPWPEPLALERGEIVACDLRADLIGGAYVWAWNTDAGNRRRFRQSTFGGLPPSVSRLRRRHSDYRPGLNDEAAIDAHALALLGDGRTLGDVAAQLRQRFHDRLPTEDAALARAADLAERYAK